MRFTTFLTKIYPVQKHRHRLVLASVLLLAAAYGCKKSPSNRSIVHNDQNYTTLEITENERWPFGVEVSEADNVLTFKVKGESREYSSADDMMVPGIARLSMQIADSNGVILSIDTTLANYIGTTTDSLLAYQKPMESPFRHIKKTNHQDTVLIRYQLMATIAVPKAALYTLRAGEQHITATIDIGGYGSRVLPKNINPKKLLPVYHEVLRYTTVIPKVYKSVVSVEEIIMKRRFFDDRWDARMGGKGTPDMKWQLKKKALYCPSTPCTFSEVYYESPRKKNRRKCYFVDKAAMFHYLPTDSVTISVLDDDNFGDDEKISTNVVALNESQTNDRGYKLLDAGKFLQSLKLKVTTQKANH